MTPSTHPDALIFLFLLVIRYFKQIAKSVRANGSASSGSEENADDFLGCINMPLNVSPQRHGNGSMN
jgi:hypothetical protein